MRLENGLLSDDHSISAGADPRVGPRFVTAANKEAYADACCNGTLGMAYTAILMRIPIALPALRLDRL